MPMHDIADHPLVAALQDAFGTLIEDNAVDIVPQDEHGTPESWEVQADAWTLVLEGWPLDIAWIAIDEEVADARQAQLALESTLDRRELAGSLAQDDDAGSGSVAGSTSVSGAW